MFRERLCVDVGALKCPILLVTVKLWLKKLQKNQYLEVLIDDQVGQNDVEKYLVKAGFCFSVEPSQGSQVKLIIAAQDT